MENLTLAVHVDAVGMNEEVYTSSSVAAADDGGKSSSKTLSWILAADEDVLEHSLPRLALELSPLHSPADASWSTSELVESSSVTSLSSEYVLLEEEHCLNGCYEVEQTLLYNEACLSLEPLLCSLVSLLCVQLSGQMWCVWGGAYSGGFKLKLKLKLKLHGR